MALCVAIFGSNNSLLFSKIKNVEETQCENIYMFLYCSYDIIGERAKLTSSKSTQENYLGLLLLNTDYRAYGYLTNTNIKFVIITDAANTVLKDQNIRTIFKKLHTNYCKAILNPFYTLMSPLNSKFLDETALEIFEN